MTFTMTVRCRALIIVAALFACQAVTSIACAADDPNAPQNVPPEIQTLQPGVRMTMLAEHPDLVTPTGIDVDPNGSIMLVASHTHFRPDSYDGPEHDEVLIFDAKGKNRRVSVSYTHLTLPTIYSV